MFPIVRHHTARYTILCGRSIFARRLGLLAFGWLLSVGWIVSGFAAPNNHYTVSHWQKEDGLPSDSVISLSQTPDGFLWVGTAEGLARFDGVRFVTIREPAELVGQAVGRLYTDRSGALWVSTRAGALLRRVGTQFVVFGADQGWTNSIGQSITEDRAGAVWLSTRSGSVFRFQGGIFECVMPEVREGPASTVIAADVWGGGPLWIRRGMSVGYVDGTNWIPVARSAALPERLGAMTPSRSGGVWLFASDFGIDRLGQGRWPLNSKPYPPVHGSFVFTRRFEWKPVDRHAAAGTGSDNRERT